MTAIVEAMTALPKRERERERAVQSALSLWSAPALTKMHSRRRALFQVQEMACIALQNTAMARIRTLRRGGRRRARRARSRRSSPVDKGARRVGADAHRRRRRDAPPDCAQGERAEDAGDQGGAKEEWVKPIAQGGGILPSARLIRHVPAEQGLRRIMGYA